MYRRIISTSLALCVAMGALIVAQAQTARPSQGALIVNVPRGMLPSEDYWLYVNRRIVSGAPHTKFASLVGEFMRVESELWDVEGRAASFKDGRLTVARPGLRERIFERQPPIPLDPGKYVVELMTRADNAPFPFAISRIDVQVASGKTEEIEFGIPVGTDEVKVIHALRCSLCSISPYSPEETLKFIQEEFDRTVQSFDKLPTVALLNEAMLNLPIDPAKHPVVSVSLPASVGGGREMDARQIALIVGDLLNEFRFPSISGNERIQKADSPVPQLAALLDVKIAAFRKRMETFNRITKSMDDAKRP